MVEAVGGNEDYLDGMGLVVVLRIDKSIQFIEHIALIISIENILVFRKFHFAEIIGTPSH